MTNFQNSASGPLAHASAKATVKWFNATKGYGFVTLDNGGDAFCHASALQSVGTPNLPQGATLICDLQDSPRGLQVVAVHSVDTSTADPNPRKPRRDFEGGGGRYDGGDHYGGGDRYGSHDRFSSNYRERDTRPSGPMVEGKVKFFNDQKGFGFVMPDNGSGDIYLHASALRRSGIQAVEPEQRIRYSTRQGQKGVEVDKVELL